MAKLQGKTAVGLAQTAPDESSSTPCNARTKKQATTKAKKPSNPKNINKTSLPSEFDVIGGTDIAPETVTAVNATIISSFGDESKSNDDIFCETVIEPETEATRSTTAIPPTTKTADTTTAAMEAAVEMTIDEKIDLPQIGVKVPPNNEVVMLSPKSEIILEVALTELRPPEFHPFQVNHDEAMDRLAESIKEYGVYEPGVARPKIDENGNFDGYELLSGNRRKMACGLAGLSTMLVIIRELDDDSAVIAMVDSNLEQREKILYSEKAWAYKIKMEALNHQGIKKNGKTSAEIITEQTGDSRNHIFRLIRLTELVVGLLDKVDAEQLSFHSAVELSYLSPNEQFTVISAMESNDMKPSVSQAVKLKNLKQSGELTEEQIYSILAEEKPKSSPAEAKVKLYRKFFPADYTPKQITKVITDLLKVWQKENLLANKPQGETSSLEQTADVTNTSSDGISSGQAAVNEGGAVNA